MAKQELNLLSQTGEQVRSLTTLQNKPVESPPVMHHWLEFNTTQLIQISANTHLFYSRHFGGK